MKLIDQRVLGKTTAKTFDFVKLSAYPYLKNTTNRVYGMVSIKNRLFWGRRSNTVSLLKENKNGL